MKERSPEEYDNDDKDDDGVANIMMRCDGKIKASGSGLVSPVVLCRDFHQQVDVGGKGTHKIPLMIPTQISTGPRKR